MRSRILHRFLKDRSIGKKIDTTRKKLYISLKSPTKQTGKKIRKIKQNEPFLGFSIGIFMTMALQKTAIPKRIKLEAWGWA